MILVIMIMDCYLIKERKRKSKRVILFLMLILGNANNQMNYQLNSYKNKYIKIIKTTTIIITTPSPHHSNNHIISHSTSTHLIIPQLMYLNNNNNNNIISNKNTISKYKNSQTNMILIKWITIIIIFNMLKRLILLLLSITITIIIRQV